MKLASTLLIGALLSATPLASSGCGGAAEATVQTREVPPADPKAAKKYLEGARLLARPGTNRDRRAMELFREAVAIDPFLWEAHYNWGVVLRRRGDLREALTHFKAAHDIQPAAHEPTLALAESQYALGEGEQATDLLEVYLEAHPDTPGVRVALTAMLRERGMYDDALKQARAALVRNAQDVQALAEVGRIYRAQGDLDVAELVLKKAVDLDAASAPLQNDLGLVALARGDTELAFSYFAKATELDATFTPSRMNRASVLLNAGDYAAAAGEYQSVLASNADDADAHVGLGVALRGQGEPRKAKKEYEMALALVPGHAAANFNLAILYAEFLEQRPEARPLFEQFLESAADNDPHREVAERYMREIPEPAAAPAPRARRRRREHAVKRVRNQRQPRLSMLMMLVIVGSLLGGSIVAFAQDHGERAPAPAPSAGDDAAPTKADQAKTEVREERGEKVKAFQFSGLDIEGQLKSPQMLYFLNRLRAEFGRPRLPHRSFMPELQRSTKGKSF